MGRTTHSRRMPPPEGAFELGRRIFDGFRVPARPADDLPAADVGDPVEAETPVRGLSRQPDDTPRPVLARSHRPEERALAAAVQAVDTQRRAMAGSGADGRPAVCQRRNDPVQRQVGGCGQGTGDDDAEGLVMGQPVRALRDGSRLRGCRGPGRVGGKWSSGAGPALLRLPCGVPPPSAADPSASSAIFRRSGAEAVRPIRPPDRCMHAPARSALRGLPPDRPTRPMAERMSPRIAAAFLL